MKKLFIIVTYALILLYTPIIHAEKETVSERLIRVEESIKSLDMRLSQRIEDTNKQIDLLRRDIDRRFEDERIFNYFILGGIFTVLTLICTLIVVIIWDRRASLKPLWMEINHLKNDLKAKVYDIYEHLEIEKQGLKKFKPV